MVSALRAVDSVFKLHVFHATAKTAYLKSIKLKVTGSQSTHLTNPVVISYEKCCCRMPRLSNDERNRAVTMLLQGATQQEVATALGVHQTTVHRLQGRLVQFGNNNDRPRSGRPRCYNCQTRPPYETYASSQSDTNSCRNCHNDARNT
jgi:hypothetical protein